MWNCTVCIHWLQYCCLGFIDYIWGNVKCDTMAWCNCRASDSRSNVHGFDSRSGHYQILGNNSRQVVHTHLPLSPSIINWYRLKLGSKQATTRHTGHGLAVSVGVRLRALNRRSLDQRCTNGLWPMDDFTFTHFKVWYVACCSCRMLLEWLNRCPYS